MSTLDKNVTFITQKFKKCTVGISADCFEIDASVYIEEIVKTMSGQGEENESNNKIAQTKQVTLAQVLDLPILYE